MQRTVEMLGRLIELVDETMSEVDDGQPVSAASYKAALGDICALATALRKLLIMEIERQSGESGSV